jgi:hypothetical protein
MKNKIDLLIDLLFDNTASITERDDAAMELGEFQDSQVREALIKKGKELNEDEIVLNSCGESLGVIWVSQNDFDELAYRALLGTTRYGAYIVIKSRKPEWIEKYNLELDDFSD